MFAADKNNTQQPFLQDGEPLGFVLSNVVTLKRQVRSFSEEVTEVTPPLLALPNLKTEREDPFDQMVRGVTPDRGEHFYSSFLVGIRLDHCSFYFRRFRSCHVDLKTRLFYNKLEIRLDHCTFFFRRFRSCRFKNKTFYNKSEEFEDGSALFWKAGSGCELG